MEGAPKDEQIRMLTELILEKLRELDRKLRENGLEASSNLITEVKELFAKGELSDSQTAFEVESLDKYDLETAKEAVKNWIWRLEQKSDADSQVQ